MVVEPLIVGLLLLAGLMHASWNAILKSDTSDRLTTFGVIMTTGTLMGLLAVPFLPAIAETVPGYVLVYWLAVFAPAGTPKDIQKTLADAITEALKDPATAKAMTQGRMEISPLPLDQFAAYVKEQTAWWTKEIKAAGIEPE